MISVAFFSLYTEYYQCSYNLVDVSSYLVKDDCVTLYETFIMAIADSE